MKNKKIVLCGGGSAGHVMPNLALLPELKKIFNEIHYIGGQGIEKEIIAQHPEIKYHEISCDKLRRSLSLKNLFMPFKVIKGYYEAKKILKNIKPTILFSKGGFVSVPCVYAAHKLKIKIVSHESDFTLGLANKLIYKKSEIMFTTFKETAKYGKKCFQAGAIIRDEIFEGSKTATLNNYNLSPVNKNILVIGGSLGATAINHCIEKAAPKITEHYNLIHLTGKDKKNNYKNKNYVQIEYTDKINDLFAAADIIISRAGSGTIFEIVALNKKSILIPLSKKESRGDQILNAQSFEKSGLAKVIYEENLTPEILLATIEKMKDFVPKKNNNVIANKIIISKIKELIN